MTDYKGIFNVKFTDRYSGYCNDDLLVEMDGKFYLALSCGWKEFSTFNEAVGYSKEHSQWVCIHSVNRQHPEGRELTMDELHSIQKEYEDRGFHTFIYRD